MKIKKIKISIIYLVFFILTSFMPTTTAFSEEIELSSNKLIPVVLNQDNPTKEISFEVGFGSLLLIDVVSFVDLFEVTLVTPLGDIITQNNVDIVPGEYASGPIESNNLGALPGIVPGFHYIYNIPNPIPGSWKVIITGINLPLEGNALVVDITANNSLKGGLFIDSSQYIVGDPVLLLASLFNDLSPVGYANVQALITDDTNGQQITSVTLKDDGVDSDDQTGDGLYSGTYITTKEGDFSARVIITGDLDGKPYELTYASSFSVRNPTARYSGFFNDEPVDDDNNGLIDSININVGCDIELGGNYRISLTLIGDNGNSSTSTTTKELNSSFGQIVSIIISKEELLNIGVDGPYTISSITIERLDNGNWFLFDEQSDIGATRPYSLTDLERDGISLNGILSDQGVDTDANGLYNYLSVNINVDLIVGGYYQWSGKLSDEFGTEIEFKGNAANLVSGINSVSLTFDGNKIGEDGLDGPYKIMDFLMFGSGKSLVSNYVGETSFYSFTEFEGSANPGDLDGDGDIDIDDINVIKTNANQPASVNPDADIDGDGMITVMDARMLMMDCTLPRCARP